MRKVKIYKNGKKTIAVAKYKGQTVRAVAICNDSDTYDESIGEQLATARLNEKLALKKFERARLAVNKANDALYHAEKMVDEASIFYSDAIKEIDKYSNELTKLETELGL